MRNVCHLLLTVMLCAAGCAATRRAFCPQDVPSPGQLPPPPVRPTPESILPVEGEGTARLGGVFKILISMYCQLSK